MEDYWNIPRELIYRERENLNDFGVKDNHILNGRLFRLLSEHFLSTDDADKLLLQCFNNAYYLCTIILLEDLPHLRVDKYEKNLLGMNVQWNDDACAASFALAYEMLQVCEPKYTNDILLLKAIHNRFHCRHWIGIAAANTFYNLIDKVKKYTFTLPQNEFAPRDIVETIEELGEKKPYLLEQGVEYICERLAHVSEPRKRIYGADLAIAHLKGFLQETYENYGYDPKTKRFESVEPGVGYDIHYIESFESDVDSIKEAIKYITEHYPSKENVVEPERALDNKNLQTSTREQDSKLIEQVRELQQKLAEKDKALQKAHQIIEELRQPVEELTAEQKVRMAFALQLFKAAGLTDRMLKRPNGVKVATIMQLLLNIHSKSEKAHPAQICSNFLSNPKYYPRDKNMDLLIKLNLLCAELGINACLSLESQSNRKV